jgi:hypothetical protein
MAAAEDNYVVLLTAQSDAVFAVIHSFNGRDDRLSLDSGRADLHHQHVFSGRGA